MAGDFNSSQAWGRPGRPYHHADMVQTLATPGLVSVYHRYYRENQGSETRITFYMARKKERGFHIDYCFLPKAWMPVRKIRSGGHL
jgi:exodeoxyribonuclease-3